MVRSGRILVGALAVLVAAGCGSSGGGSGKASKPPSKDASLAAAAAINLKAADMPGYKAEPADDSSDTSTDKEEKQLGVCVGIADMSDANDVVDESSDDFSKGEEPNTLTVSSSVTVAKSASQAKADLKAFQSDKATDCMKTFVNDVFKAQVGESAGVTFGDVSVSALRPSASGTDGSFGYLVNASVSAQGVSFPFSMSIEGALKNHTELTMMTFSIGTPLSVSERDALWSKLIDRLKASAV